MAMRRQQLFSQRRFPCFLCGSSYERLSGEKFLRNRFSEQSGTVSHFTGKTTYRNFGMEREVFRVYCTTCIVRRRVRNVSFATAAPTSISTATRRVMSNKFVKFRLLNASATILLGS